MNSNKVILIFLILTISISVSFSSPIPNEVKRTLTNNKVSGNSVTGVDGNVRQGRFYPHYGGFGFPYYGGGGSSSGASASASASSSSGSGGGFYGK